MSEPALDFYGAFLPFFALIFALCGLIVSLDCLWRAKKRLAIYFALQSAAAAAFVARQIIWILELKSPASGFSRTIQVVDAIALLFLLAAGMEMYRIIRILDRENPEK